MRHCIAPPRSLLVWLLAALALAPLGCEDEGEEKKDAGPIVGVMELPISLRNDGSAPGAAPLVEISPKELRVDGDKLYDLDNGTLPDSATEGTDLSKLTPKLGGKGAKLRMHVNTSYQTMALVAGSVAEGHGTLAIEVRKGSSADTGWLVLEDFEVAAESDEPVELSAGVQRSWDEVGKHWQHMYDACQPSSTKVDCDYTPHEIAEGGKAEITLFARDNAVQLLFERFGAPDPEEEEEGEGGGGGAGLLEGVRAPEPAEEEEEIPPATDATFTWRHEESTADESAISEAIKPLCGAERCGVVVVSDSGTSAMRVVSLIGAAFPNGAAKPFVHFTAPER